MKKVKLKLILFDLDGTLIDTDDLIIHSYEYVFKKHLPNYELTEEEKISFLGPRLVTIFTKYFSDNPEIYIKDYYDYFNKHKKEEIKVYDGVYQALETLINEGYILGIITMRYANSVNDLLKMLKLDKYFSCVISLDDVSNPKPDPEGIFKAMDMFNARTNNTLFIGDNNSDYLAGINSGVFTGMVTWSKGRDNSALDCTMHIDNYYDFIEQIRRFK